MTEFEFDIAISFAGAQRAEAEGIARCLKAAGVRVFYDDDEATSLWGKNLVDTLESVYRKKARYCLMLVSREYAARSWPNHERASAQARALAQDDEYILPVRFDDTEVPGLLPSIAYLNFTKEGLSGVCRNVIAKLASVDAPVVCMSGEPPLESCAALATLLNTQSFYVTTATPSGEFRAVNHLRLIAFPRAVCHRPLDLQAQRRFKRSVRETFPTVPRFDNEISRGQYFQVSSRERLWSTSNRSWITWENGATGYVANLVPDKADAAIPLGDVVAHMVSFIRFAARVHDENLYRGPVQYCSLLACPTVRFSPRFPPPDLEPGEYDLVGGIIFPEEHAFCRETCERGWNPSSEHPEYDVADILLYQLAETKGAKIDRMALLRSVVSFCQASST